MQKQNETAATATAAPKAAKPETAKPAPRKRTTKAKAAKSDANEAEKTAAIVSRGLARDAATITRGATNFAQSSDRDTAYLLFFGRVMRANGHKATLAQIHESGTDAGGNKRRNPHYRNGSAKATDAGAINRLANAGYITKSPDGYTLTATAKAKANKHYNGNV